MSKTQTQQKTYTSSTGATFDVDRPDCPRCRRPWGAIPYAPGISRKDNLTELCSDCCTVEAFEGTRSDGRGTYGGPVYWRGAGEAQ